MLEEKNFQFRHYIPRSFPVPLVLVTAGILFVLIFFFSYQFFQHTYLQEESSSNPQLGLALTRAENQRGEDEAEVQDEDKVRDTEDLRKPPEEIYVHVDGEVKQPGLYKLASGSRVDEAIKLAGGLSDKASTRQLNFALLLKDGMKLYIPSKEEEVEPEAVNPMNAQAQETKTQGKVNINTANLSELQQIKGVGEKTAQAIIEERSKRGPFKSTQDICRVSGIGTKKYEQLKDEICVK